MALSERRYTPYFGVCHFNGSRYGLRVQRRERHAAPLQQQVRSAECHQTYSLQGAQ